MKSRKLTISVVHCKSQAVAKRVVNVSLQGNGSSLGRTHKMKSGTIVLHKEL